MCMTTTMVNHFCCEFHRPFPKVYASKDIDRHYRHGDPADLNLGMFRLHHRLRLEAEKRPPQNTREIWRNNRINQKSGRNGSMKIYMKIRSPYLNKTIEHPWTLLETCGNWQTNLLKFVTREMHLYPMVSLLKVGTGVIGPPLSLHVRDVACCCMLLPTIASILLRSVWNRNYSALSCILMDHGSWIVCSNFNLVGTGLDTQIAEEIRFWMIRLLRLWYFFGKLTK